MAAASPPMFAGLYTQILELFWVSKSACTQGSCHFHRPSCGAPHMPLPSTPPNCCRPARIAPPVVVFDGYRKPDSEPAKPKRSGWKQARAIAAYPPWDAPTTPWPPGARPLLAASQSGNSCDRNVSHCLLPSRSQLVYMLKAPPAGAATEIPLPANVFIALPAVTQLLTSGAALKASSRYTACGPPARKATGMSRPIAAEGTISVSYPAARAEPPSPTTKLPTVNTAAHSSRSSIDRLLITDLACRSTTSKETEDRPRFRKVANHTRESRTPETTNGDDLARSSPSAVLFLAQVCWPAAAAAGAPAGAPGPGPAPGVAPRVACRSGSMACNCAPQYGQSCVPLASKWNCAL